MEKDLIEVSTYEHFDGFYIFKREDTGQEVSRNEFSLLEIISLKDNKFNLPTKDTNAILFMKRKIDENYSLNQAYYICLKDMPDDGIRSFCNKKIYGKTQWLEDIKNQIILSISK